MLTLFFHLQTDNKMQPSIAKRFTFFRYTKYICWKSIFFVIKTLNLPNSEIFGCKVFICETELHNKCFPKIIVTSGIILGCYSFNPLVPKNLFFEYHDENLEACRYLY